MPVCKLCGAEAKLVKAHILPQWTYASMKADGGIPTEYAEDPDRPALERRTGAYDPALVCHPCEARFNPWDTYACELLGPIARHRSEIKDGGKIIAHRYDGFDYAGLKLFFVSLLWRASASREPLFHKAKCGPHERRLRQMVLDADPGPWDEFSVNLFFYDDVEAARVVPNPRPGRVEGINFMRFWFDGYKALIKVDQRSLPAHLAQYSLRPERAFVVGIFPWKGSHDREELLHLVYKREHGGHAR